jgi:hypothetical protein
MKITSLRRMVQANETMLCAQRCTKAATIRMPIPVQEALRTWNGEGYLLSTNEHPTQQVHGCQDHLLLLYAGIAIAISYSCLWA